MSALPGMLPDAMASAFCLLNPSNDFWAAAKMWSQPPSFVGR